MMTDEAPAHLFSSFTAHLFLLLLLLRKRKNERKRGFPYFFVLPTHIHD
jgi:hypothetical protein